MRWQVTRLAQLADLNAESMPTPSAVRDEEPAPPPPAAAPVAVAATAAAAATSVASVGSRGQRVVTGRAFNVAPAPPAAAPVLRKFPHPAGGSCRSFLRTYPSVNFSIQFFLNFL